MEFDVETTKQNVFNNAHVIVQDKNGGNREFALDNLRQMLVSSIQGLQHDISIDKILNLVQYLHS